MYICITDFLKLSQNSVAEKNLFFFQHRDSIGWDFR